jgi:hypothetical protein
MKHYLKAALLALTVAAIGIAFAGRDGSGTFSLPAGNPVVAGNQISSSWANTTLSDIATALSNSIAKDGQTVPTANLPMGTFKHTNVADATARNQYASAAQLQDFSLQTLGSVSGTNTIVGSLSPAITAYSAHMLVAFTPANNNTGAATLAVNGLTALDVQKADGDALAAGDLFDGIPALLVLDEGADDWILLNPQTGIEHVHSAADITSGTLAVARGGTGTTTSTGSGSVVLSASPTFTGTVTAATVNATTLQQGGVAAATVNSNWSAADITSGTLAVARGGTGQTDGTARNITGKAGVAKTLSTSAPSGGSDGDIWYRY